jgi:hypothetical protein
MVRDIVKNLERGVVLNDHTVYINTAVKGRFQEELDLDVYLKKNSDEAHLLYLKIFDGRRPYYRPWVELYGIDGRIHVGNSDIDYFNSPLEKSFLQYLAKHIGPGENLFVDYHKDTETRKQLEKDIPAAVSRLGFMLYRLGFTWFKDWYFPEGFMEGEQKLQAEKPLNELEKNRQLKKIHESVMSSLRKIESVDRGDPQLSVILDRMHTVIGQNRRVCATEIHL